MNLITINFISYLYSCRFINVVSCELSVSVLLAERNENMKKSLDTYKNLQMAMASIHEDHKQKYEESRTVIEQVRSSL